MERARLIGFAVIALGVLLAPLRVGHYVQRAPLDALGAFVCAGSIAAAHGDPYRVEPLRTCEQSLPTYRPGVSQEVEPAPLPPYALLAFAPLGALPFGAAVLVFWLLLIAATAATVLLVRQLTGLPWTLLGVVFFVGTLVQSGTFGEIPPLGILAVCAAAGLIEDGRAWWAAAALAAGTIEPHMLAGPIAAAFVFRPRMRVPLLAAAAVLLAVSAAVGPGLALEYVTRALPAHAAAEIPAADQFSLTWVLHWLGAPDRLAVGLGWASYLVLALAGIVLGKRLADRYARPALLVLVPAAFAAVGGVFVHDVQLPFALPAALLLFAVARGTQRALLLGAVLALGLVWHPQGLVMVAEAALCALAAWDASRPAVGLACAAGYLAFLELVRRLPAPAAAHPAASRHAADAIASVAWGDFVRSTGYGDISLPLVLAKLPLWAALAVVVASAFVMGRQSARARNSSMK